MVLQKGYPQTYSEQVQQQIAKYLGKELQKDPFV